MSLKKSNIITKQKLLEENEDIRARLAEAEDTLRAIREGEVDAIVVSGSRGEQVFSLSGSESVYRLIFETMHEAAFTVSFDGRILFCNRQFSSFVGTPQEKIIGRKLADFVPPEQGGEAALLLEQSRSQTVTRRMVFQGAGAAAVPAHVSATVLHQAEGESICVVATDLSELEASTVLLQKLRNQQEALTQTLREKEILMREIHHRVKNNLSILSSLLQLEMGKLQDDLSKQVFINAQTRINSISAVYELLNRSGGIENVDLFNYVRDLADMLIQTYSTEKRRILLTTKLVNVQLDVKRAISLGIILNELIANAIKHAFPEGLTGNIKIDLADSGGLIDLTIADDGVGLPEGFNIETTDSLGWKLVSILSNQLNAKLAIDNTRGTKVVVSFAA